MPLTAGELRTRARFEARSLAVNECGDRVESWAVVGYRWAYIEPISGREMFASDQTTAMVTHRVRIWYWSAVQPGMRIVVRDRILHIESVLDIGEQHREMELLCTERAS